MGHSGAEKGAKEATVCRPARGLHKSFSTHPQPGRSEFATGALALPPLHARLSHTRSFSAIAYHAQPPSPAAGPPACRQTPKRAPRSAAASDWRLVFAFMLLCASPRSAAAVHGAVGGCAASQRRRGRSMAEDAMQAAGKKGVAEARDFLPRPTLDAPPHGCPRSPLCLARRRRCWLPGAPAQRRKRSRCRTVPLPAAPVLTGNANGRDPSPLSPPSLVLAAVRRWPHVDCRWRNAQRVWHRLCQRGPFVDARAVRGGQRRRWADERARAWRPALRVGPGRPGAAPHDADLAPG